MFNLTRGEELTALIAVVVVGLATGAVCFLKGDRVKTVEIPLNNSGEITVQRGGNRSQKQIKVHVTGEVRKPGVFELSALSIVKDAVELAGPTEEADTSAMNLAAPLVDGERIAVPSKKAAGRRAESAGRRSAIKVNVNAANRQQLESLPGIGPTLAGRILELRETRKFEKVDDLLQVRGIGPITLEKIRGYVSVK